MKSILPHQVAAIKRRIIITLICLLLVFVVIPVRAQLSFNRVGENHAFGVTGVGGMKTHYPVFSFEQSYKRVSLFFGVGGGLMGWDKQQADRDAPDFWKKYNAVANSKVLPHLPIRLDEQTFMWRTQTSYTGIMVKGGIRRYFGRQYYRRRMNGLYVGFDMSFSRMAEYQQVTYCKLTGEEALTLDGRNHMNIMGVAVKTGYNWYPGGNDRMFFSVAATRPFYIPFQQEINLSSPFAASSFEFEIGFGVRLPSN